MVSRVSEAKVLAVPEPKFTPTWHPISHKRLLKHLEAAVRSKKLKIGNRDYSMSQDGTKMFGTWIIKSGNGELEYMLGFRNSINKDFALGLTAGFRVVVCSNMVFKGDFVVSRKHTSGLTDITLRKICRASVQEIVNRFASITEWYYDLKEIKLSPEQINYLIVESMRRGAMPPSKFNEFCTLFMNEGGRYYSSEPSLSDWHGAVTEMMNKESLFAISRKNEALNDLIEKFKHLLTA